MRVTNKMLTNTFMRDMNLNMGNLKTLQSQMTSGKEISKPSDNPFKVARAMQLQSDINANKQYGENITDTTNSLDTTDTALGQAGNILQRVRELMISSGNAAYGPDQKLAIKYEINQKIGELSQVLNTNYDGSYIFGGTRGTAKPVRDYVDGTGNTVLEYANRAGTAVASAAEISMINAKISTEISQGVTMEYNVTAGDILNFKDKNGVDKSLSTLLSKITNHLDGKSDDGSVVYAGATTDLVNIDLSDITDATTNLLKIRAEVGAKANRMESAKTKNDDENFNMTEVLSKTEDVDITQKTMEYATMQTVYNASLQTSAKVLQPTIMDYLR
jgi:flagellar hook-associated protein 3 FlgL